MHFSEPKKDCHKCKLQVVMLGLKKIIMYKMSESSEPLENPVSSNVSEQNMSTLKTKWIFCSRKQWKLRHTKLSIATECNTTRVDLKYTITNKTITM